MFTIHSGNSRIQNRTLTQLNGDECWHCFRLLYIMRERVSSCHHFKYGTKAGTKLLLCSTSAKADIGFPVFINTRDKQTNKKVRTIQVNTFGFSITCALKKKKNRKKTFVLYSSFYLLLELGFAFLRNIPQFHYNNITYFYVKTQNKPNQEHFIQPSTFESTTIVHIVNQ